MGELEAKPHPWLYTETCTVGLGIPFTERNHVVGIEDSGAGACAIRLGGFTTIGIAGGNIESSGTMGVCNHYCNNFDEIIKRMLFRIRIGTENGDIPSGKTGCC